MRNTFLLLSALLCALVGYSQATNVVINELNADNPGTGGGGGGTDAAEFIELYSDPNTSLDGLVLVFFNGNAAGASYAAYDLDGYSTDAQGFFVIGGAAVTNVDFVFTGATNNIQNGADGIGLYIGDATAFPTGTFATSADLVDAIVYGTGDAQDNTVIALLGLDIATPGYAQLDETAQTTGTDLTISRIPDGGNAFSQAYVTQALTPGTFNQPPCTGGTISYNDGATDATFCDSDNANMIWNDFNGTGNSFSVITDANDNILFTTSSLSSDFTGQVGVYHIYFFAYTGTVDFATQQAGQPITGIASDDCATLSQNFLTLTINACSGCVGGEIAANAQSSITVISDSNADVLNLTNNSTSQSATYAYALLASDGSFIQWVDGTFDFNSLSLGQYFLQGISYEGALTEPAVGEAFTNISSSICYELSSNSIDVNVIVIANVLINELNADNPTGGGGTDNDEFIELYGEPNASLDGLVLVFYNGNGAVSYAAYDLDGYSTDENGFFVLGSSTVTNVDMLFTGTSNNIQNGADAVGLYIGNASDFPTNSTPSSINLVDAIVYGTGDAQDNVLITGLGLDIATPGYFQQDETAQTNGTDLTISRIPDGGAAFETNYVTQALTPGTWNLPPCNTGTITLLDGSSSVSFCDTESTLTTWADFNGTASSLAVVTDANDMIIATTTANNYDFAGIVGTYHVYFVAYTGTLDVNTTTNGLPVSGIISDACYAVSDSFISITINACSGCIGGEIAANNSTNSLTVLSDNNSDVYSWATTSTSLSATYAFVLTDANGAFLQWIDASFDFNTLGLGSYQVWGVSSEGTLNPLNIGELLSAITSSDCVELSSNNINVNVIEIAQVVINELNADNPGGPDSQEFIEFYGDANAALDNLVLVLYDGTTGLSYGALDLDGYFTDELGFFVIGDAAATNVDFIIPDGSIQNGSDAIALYAGNASDFPNGSAISTANLLDAMVYATDDVEATILITGLGLDILFPGYTQFNETAQQTGTDLTQSRVPDGGVPLNNNTVVLQALTPGTYNIVVSGCTDATACNFNIDATVDDGTCLITGTTCDDNDANTINDVITADCICAGSTVISGCTDLGACNYNADAIADDGSCLYAGDACDDGNANTTNDVYDINCLCAGTVGITEIELFSSISLYPNPAADQLNVRFNSALGGLAVQEITDITGRIISSTRVVISAGENNFRIETSTLSNGVYSLTFRIHDSLMTESFVK